MNVIDSAVSAQRDRTAVLVLGMHRSGTSAFARVANLLGCELPNNVMAAAEGNDLGFWESNAVVALNDRLLTSAGSHWDDWLPLNEGWLGSSVRSEYLSRARDVIQEEYGDSALFVLKDPRICRLAPLWIEALESLEIRPLIAQPQRNPYEVADSLMARDGSDRGLGILLWLRHVLEAESATRTLPRHFFTYDQLLADWTNVIEGFERSTGLRFPGRTPLTEPKISTFLTDDARHQRQEVAATLNGAAPIWVRDTFAIMQRWCDGKEAPEDIARLDEIRDDFNRAAPSFSRVITMGANIGDGVGSAGRTRQEAREIAEEFERVNGELKAAEEEKARLCEELKQLYISLDASGHAGDQLQQQLDAEGGKISGLMVELADARAENEQLRQELKRFSESLETSGNVADELRQSLAVESDKVSGLMAELANQGSALRQRQEEAAQAWAEVNLERQLRERAEGEVLRTLNQNENLINKFAEIEARLRADASELAQARAHADEAQHAMAARQREHEVIIARYETEAERLTAHASRADAELARLTMLHVEAYARASEAERLVASLQLEHEAAADRHAEETERLTAHARRADSELAQLTRLHVEAETRLRELEQRSTFEQDSSATGHELDSSQVEWFRKVTATLQKAPRWWTFLPEKARRRRESALLLSRGLFDPSAYLTCHSDVAREGMDPLVHYMNHGIFEGRNW